MRQSGLIGGYGELSFGKGRTSGAIQVMFPELWIRHEGWAVYDSYVSFPTVARFFSFGGGDSGFACAIQVLGFGVGVAFRRAKEPKD